MAKSVFKTTGARKAVGSFTVEFKPSEFVFKEGDLGTEMFIVQEGKIEILKQIDGETKQLSLLEKGDFFGEMSLLEELPRTASARAVDESRLLQIDGSTFDQMLRSNPEIAVRMLRKISRRLRDADLQLQRFVGDDPTSSSVQAAEVPAAVEKVDRPVGPQQLVHSSGEEFYLSAGSETTIGRRDPVTGIHPDVDLTSVDDQRSTSRRHAKIFRRGNKFFLREEIGTTNGTFINGTQVETGVPCEISNHDELRFGLVEMTFQVD